MPVIDRIQLRRDTAADWTSTNPTLAQGELGVETDTGKVKIGDGATAWTSLAYFGGAVASVNGHTGTVSLTFADVGAMQSGTGLLKASNLSDVSNVATARSSLGLGGAATLNVGTSGSTVAAGNDSRFGQIAGVTVSGTAANGQVPIASSSSAAAWGTLAASANTVPPAKWAPTVNVTISSPGATIDGLTPTNGDRVLLAFQTTQTQNGLYTYNGSSSAMTRTSDSLNGALVEVTNGSNSQSGGSQANSQWQQTTANPVIGTSNIVWQQYGPPIPVDGLATQASLRTLGPGTGQSGKYLELVTAPSWCAQGQTISREQGAGNTSVSMTTGQLLVCSTSLHAGQVISNITWMTAATAAVTPTHWWYVLLDGSLNLLAVTADQTTAAMAANTVLTLAVATIASGSASSYTVPTSGLYYVGVMVTAGTMPNFMAAPGATTTGGVAPAKCGTSTGSLTTPPAFPFTGAAITAKGANAWAGLS
jgi:hypothetical protein